DDKGGAFAVFYPGWEILQENEMIFWTRTRPEYVPDAGAQVIVTVIDDDAPTDHNVSLHASDIIALEQPLVESEFLLQRTGSTQQPLRVLLATSGSAMPGVDFEPLPSEVAFLPGEMARVIPVRPIADD